MSIRRKISAACAMAFISATVASTAIACSPEQRRSDIQNQLPKEISETITPEIGVEAIAKRTLPTGIKLQAAILVPKWFFNLCDNGPIPANDYGIRSLVVWRLDGSRWLEIGRNNEIVYVVTTAGWADVSLSWGADELALYQSSSPPPRSDFNDEYVFVYDKKMDSMVLVRHSAASHYYPMCCIGFGYDEYEEATKKYGNDICDYDGFDGEINYSLGVAKIEQCEFAKPKTSKSTNISDEAPAINTLKNVNFSKNRYFSTP